MAVLLLVDVYTQNFKVINFLPSEIVALDTEYHDPEEFLSLSPPVDAGHLTMFSTPQTFSSQHSLDGDQTVSIPTHYVNHNIIKRAPSDPVPDTPEEDGIVIPPPLPNKRGKTPHMGQISLQTPKVLLNQGGKSGEASGGLMISTVSGSMDSVAGFDADGACGTSRTSQGVKFNGQQLIAASAAIQAQQMMKKLDSGSPSPPGRTNFKGNMYPPIATKPGAKKADSKSPSRSSPLVWQARVEGDEFTSPSTSPDPKVPSAPPLPEEVSLVLMSLFFLCFFVCFSVY